MFSSDDDIEEDPEWQKRQHENDVEDMLNENSIVVCDATRNLCTLFGDRFGKLSAYTIYKAITDPAKMTMDFVDANLGEAFECFYHGIDYYGNAQLHANDFHCMESILTEVSRIIGEPIEDLEGTMVSIVLVMCRFPCVSMFLIGEHVLRQKNSYMLDDMLFTLGYYAESERRMKRFLNSIFSPRDIDTFYSRVMKDGKSPNHIMNNLYSFNV